jgi:Bifunctional DNA primase/polymerase, N-terminal
MSSQPSFDVNAEFDRLSAAAPARVKATPSEVAAPQPDGRGEFACPADGAKFMAALGIPQTPLNGKNPSIGGTDWHLRASTDFAQIDKWTRIHPGCNFGSVAFAGIGKHFVLEADSPEVRKRHRADTNTDFPKTLTIQSREGRGHRWYLQTVESIALGNISQDNKFGDFSLRMEHEQAVSPGSIHSDTGKQYRVLINAAPSEMPPADINWLGTQKKLRTKIDRSLTGKKIPYGQHDITLFSIACSLRHDGLEEQGIKACLVEVCEKRCEGFGDDYREMCAAKAASACKYPPGTDKGVIFKNSAYRVPPAHVESNEPEPVAADVHTIRVPDMDEKVLVGRLGEIYDKYMRKDFPISYAWLALVTAAGMIVPSGDHIRTNFYSALVGGVHVGKSQCIEWVLRMLGLTPPILMRVNAGSGEALSIGRLSKADGQSRLLFVDELSHLLAKSQIEGASFPFLLNQAYYQQSFEILASRGREVSIHCNLSIIGGVVEQSFDTAFGAASVGGLYDRFALAQAPSGYQFDYRPCPHGQVLSMDPADVTVDPQVWETKSELVKTLGINPRVFEIGLKVAAVCASVDGRSVLKASDLEPVIPFVTYQSDARKVLQPNAGENVDGILASKFLNYIERHGAHGEWLEVRTLLRHTRAYDYGVGYQRVLDGLMRGGEIDQHGRGVKGQKHLVRRSAVSKSDEGVQK